MVTAGPFDLQPLKRFAPVKAGRADLGGVQWVQRVKAVKSGAKVLAVADRLPVLVTGMYGKGTVIVWLGAPLGQPAKGITPYWESQRWLDFLKDIVKGQ